MTNTLRLRWVLAALLLANLGYLVWTQGGLAMFGTVPASFAEREPQRMAQQVRPAALQIRQDAASAPAAAPPAVPPTEPAPPAEPAPVDGR